MEPAQACRDLLRIEAPEQRRNYLASILPGTDAHALADVLKAEAERHIHVRPIQAHAIAERIGEVGLATGNASIQALGLLADADALREMGHYTDALATYDRAGALFLSVDDEVGWARSRIGFAGTCSYTGHVKDALTTAHRARQILAAHGLWLRLARLESVIGLLHREIGQIDEALACYERALAAAGRLVPRDEALEAEIVLNQGIAFDRAADYERAAELYGRAVEAFTRLERPGPVAQAQANLAMTLMMQGFFSRAMSLVNAARRTFFVLGRRGGASMAGQTGVECLIHLNRLTEAIELANQVVHEFEREGAQLELARTLKLRGLALQESGQLDAATADLHRAEQLFAAAGCSGWVAAVQLQRSTLLEQQGHWQAALDQATAAGMRLRERGLLVDAALADLGSARAWRALGQAPRARAAARAALRFAEDRRVPWLAFRAWRILGELALGTDSEQEFVATVAAVEALEQVQGRIHTEYRASFLTDKIGAYEDAVALCLERGRADQAFEYAERAKSRALLDAVNGELNIRVRARTPQEAELVHELTELRRTHNRLSTTLVDGHVAGPDLAAAAPPGMTAPDGGHDLFACEERIRLVLEELRLIGSSDLERIALLQGKPYSPRPFLDDATLLVEYFFARDDLVIFVVGTDSVQATRVPDGIREVARAHATFWLNLEAAATVLAAPGHISRLERNARAALGRLYEILIAPVRDRIAGRQRLVVVPHGSLHDVPFAALFDGARYLMEDREVTIAPSASALTIFRRPRARSHLRALVIANSDHGRLPWVLEEAASVAAIFDSELLMEDAATIEAVRQHAAAADLIHLAAHGDTRPDAPLFSSVRLADGDFTALDSLDLELDCALVALSACESGPAWVDAGDEPVGLSRSLLYAGARSVVQSLWRVDDRATSTLMQTFYRLLRDGRGRGEALRLAQLALLHAGPEYSHPFFWAPFVLVGDWGPLNSEVERDFKPALETCRA